MKEFLHVRVRLLVVSAFLSSAAISANAHLSSNQHLNVQDAVGNLPLAFEENRGQANPAVQFISNGPGYKLFLTAQEAVMVFGKFEKQKPQLQALSGGLQTSSTPDYFEAVVRMRFEHANEAASVKGYEPLVLKSNYFIGNDTSTHATNIPNHAQVKYTNIYPGIDLVYYGRNQQLEYDLIVAPRANPGQIKIAFSGADRIALSKSGDLVIGTPVGDVHYRKPFAYQDIQGKRRPVAAKYTVAANGKIGFELGKYDKNQQLIIDPILSYASFLWGESASGIAVDAIGNIFVSGFTTSADLPTTSGYQTRLIGTVAAYVVKLNASASQALYATYLGARNAETRGHTLSVDNAGNAYIAGKTQSTAFPTTAGAYQTTATAPTSSHSFVTKLNATGSALVYSTYLDGIVEISSTAVDSAGSLFMTGNAMNNTYKIGATPGAFQSQKPSTANSTPFVAKLNTAGSGMAYVTYLGGSSDDTSSAIAIDSSGNAYVTGNAISSNFPMQNALQPYLRGGNDVFIAKLNPTGTGLIFSTYLGGSAGESGKAIAVDSAGQAYIAGESWSDDFPVTEGAFQPDKGSPGPQSVNAFISKLSSTGAQLVYSSYLGGAGTYSPAPFGTQRADIDSATAVKVDAAGYAYIGGHASASTFPLVDPILVQGPRRWYAPFVSKVTPNGDRLVYSATIGPPKDAYNFYYQPLNALALDANGAVYAVGTFIQEEMGFFPTFDSTLFYPTADAILTSGKSYLTKLSTGKYPTTLRSSANPISSTAHITFTADVQSTSPGGTVTFRNGEAILGTAPVVNGAATFTTTLPVGGHKITATYSADGKVSPAIFQMVTSQ